MPTLPNPVRQAPQRHLTQRRDAADRGQCALGGDWRSLAGCRAPSRIRWTRGGLLLAALRPLPVSRDAVRALAELAREHHLDAGQTLF